MIIDVALWDHRVTILLSAIIGWLLDRVRWYGYPISASSARIGYRYNKASDDTDEAAYDYEILQLAVYNDRGSQTVHVTKISHSTRLHRLSLAVPNHRNDYARSLAFDQEQHTKIRNAKIFCNLCVNIFFCSSVTIEKSNNVESRKSNR